MFKASLIHTPLNGHVHVPGMLLELLESYIVLHTPMCITVFLSNLSFFHFCRKKKKRSHREKYVQLYAHVISFGAWVLHWHKHGLVHNCVLMMTVHMDKEK